MAKRYSGFKVLFVYPNIQMRTIAPVGISTMAALLREHDCDVEVFDCTRYEAMYVAPDRDYDTSHEKFVRAQKPHTHRERVQNSNVLPFDWKERKIELRTTPMDADFQKKIEDFGPDLVAFSLVENTFQLGMDMVALVPEGIPTLCGGVFCTYAPDVVMRHPRVDYLCRGEGEFPLLDLVGALAEGRRTDDIPNIWARDGDRIVKNEMRPAVAIDDLPIPDYSVFEESLLYTPMQGAVWRAVGFETQRGCPYTCTYCNSPSNNVLYAQANAGGFYRKKSIPRLERELDTLVERHDPELIYFVADTFLAMSRRELDELSELYQSYRIPFWMNTRAETVNAHSAAHLARMNCLRFNIGIEHGNADFRRHVLKRAVSNDRMVEAFGHAAEYADHYTCVANSIIGLPTETPELVFDTIELNRRLPEDIFAAGAFIFVPYHGTALRDLAIEKGYIEPDLICTDASNTTAKTFLDMPELPDTVLKGLMKTFSFYVKFPKERWPEIDLAREDSEEGRARFDALREEYAETYLLPMAEKTQLKQLATPSDVPRPPKDPRKLEVVG